MAGRYVTRVPLRPEPIWAWARALQQRGHTRSARALKALCFVLFRAVLPPECAVGNALSLGHLGLNVVLHPNASVGSRVLLWHSVTLASEEPPGTNIGPTIGDDVVVGAHALILHSRRRPVVIGNHARIGAGAVVTSSVPDGAV